MGVCDVGVERHSLLSVTESITPFGVADKRLLCGTNGNYSFRLWAGNALLRWQVRLFLLDVRSTVPFLMLAILLCLLLVAADE